MKAIIYDYETFSYEPLVAPVASLAILEFDTSVFIDKTKPEYTLDGLLDKTKFYKFNVKEQVEKYDRKIEKSTLEWIAKLPKAVQDLSFVAKENDLSITELPNIFADFNIDKNTLVYTRGNTFEPVITDTIFKKLGLTYEQILDIIPWFSYRDTRSTIEGLMFDQIGRVKNSFIPPGYEHLENDLHDPKLDIVLDVLRMQYLTRAIYCGSNE